MRILYIASRFPFPLVQGDRVRAFHHLRILSRCHDVTLLTPQPVGDRESSVSAVQPFCSRMEVVDDALWRRLSRLIRIPFSALPMQTLYSFDPRFRQRAHSLLESAPYDLVHVQLARMAPVAQGLAGVPAVLDLVDALSLNTRRRASRERGPARWVLRFEARRLERYELALARQYEQLVVSSPVDRQAIGDYGNLHVIPNGVHLEDHPFVDGGRQQAHIAFTGRMCYFPNVDAATWFASKVFPIVRRQAPDARFFVVGADPAPAVKRLAAQPGVVVSGSVPRVHDYLARVGVAVAPMQGGSGMQFKVLEAMASGVPLVATLYALGGIDAIHGEHLLVAQDAEEFAAHVVRLQKNPVLARRLAQNARRLVEERYSWERSVDMLTAVYRLAIAQRRAL